MLLRGICCLHFPRTGNASRAAQWGKAPGCGQEAKVGVGRKPRPEPLLGSPGEGWGNSLGLASLNNEQALGCRGWP